MGAKSPVYVAGFERGVRPMGALVDVDDLVEVLEPGEPFVRARHDARPVEMPRQRAVEDVLDERRLPRAAHARHRDEESERNLERDVAEVVLARLLHAQHAPRVAGPALVPCRDLLASAQVGRGD